MRSPYENKSSRSFWKSAVASRNISNIGRIYDPKFFVSKQQKVVTLGSCFAQHIAKNMKAKGYLVVDTEPSPPGLIENEAKRYGYDLFSARTGNIYVMRQLLQLYEEAHGMWKPIEPVWEKNGRFYDAMRPSVEPSGLDSPGCVIKHREKHLQCLMEMFSQCDVFIFTLGLTESWVSKKSGEVYPTAPGTVAGEFDEDKYEFKNFTFQEIYSDFLKFLDYLKSSNPEIKVLLTVSPVPLTATATDDHVMVATAYSKSVLRAVAGQLEKDFECVDYFPSYDIITSALSAGKLYQSNLRSVTQEGVAIAMSSFFSANGDSFDMDCLLQDKKNELISDMEDSEFCDDVLLEVFGK